MQTRTLTRLVARLPLVLPFALVTGAYFFGAPAPLCASAGPADTEPARVSIATEDKLNLIGTYYAPREGKQKAPGALLVHDAGGKRADLAQLAARLQKSGFAVLTLDLRGHGESATSSLNWKSLDEDGKTRAWAFMPRDVKAGVEFLTGQASVHSTTVSLVGHGAGCTLVARHATRDEMVRDLVLLSPLPEQLGFTLLRDLESLGGLPTYIVVGKDESSTGKRLAEAANRAAGGAETTESIVSKVDAKELLDDSKLPAELARWMQSKALPGSIKPVEAKAGRDAKQ